MIATRIVCRADEFYIASWNVENLFDLEDDPDVEFDEDFTPESPKKWTKERLEIKLKNLADVIGKMNGGKGPDVLGLCEVENRKVVEMLVEKLAPLGRKYEIVHKDSPSDRGIDCALLYDANVFGLADSKFHFVDAEKTRDIVEARLHRDGGDLFVFVNHWPSRQQRRMAAAQGGRRAAQAARRNPCRRPEGRHRDGRRLQRRAGQRLDQGPPARRRSKENLPAGALFDTTAPIRADGKGTFVYENKWELLDHIIISPGLLDEAGFHWKDGQQRANRIRPS